MADLPTASTWFPTVEGLPGKSAYEIAVDEGFLGSEAQWLATLIGPAGATGSQGDPGPTGAAGVVQSVVPGTNVTVDATDPANPVVNASGGGGGGGFASYWPSGMVYFLDYQTPWQDFAFPVDGETILWVMPIDSDATFTGIQYSVPIADAAAEVWFEVHRVAGHGLPGALVVSKQLDVAATGAGKVATFSSPVAFSTGMYFFSVTSVNDGAAVGRFDGQSLSLANASTFTSSLLLTNFWVAFGGTTEYPGVKFLQTHLPGGVFTPGADWTGVSLEVADVTATGQVPIIGLIKQ